MKKLFFLLTICFFSCSLEEQNLLQPDKRLWLCQRWSLEKYIIDDIEKELQENEGLTIMYFNPSGVYEVSDNTGNMQPVGRWELDTPGTMLTIFISPSLYALKQEAKPQKVSVKISQNQLVISDFSVSKSAKVILKVKP
ncbi:MAG: hypothetical protein H7Y04_13680 [Verrucomicrobia bacterium]|nr:hypothetical protein [Cytophagales bacterium]